MNSKKAKRLRRELKYSLKEERINGRDHFSLQHKEIKDAEGNPRYEGIISSQERRLYQLLKKYG